MDLNNFSVGALNITAHVVQREDEGVLRILSTLSPTRIFRMLAKTIEASVTDKNITESGELDVMV